MSKYEERAYNVGRTKPNIAGLKQQLVRLKHDLEQFTANKPDGAVVGTLKARIRELEATIAEADANRKRESQGTRNAADDAEQDRQAGVGAGTTRSAGFQAVAPRFPPRGRPGRG